MAFHFEKPTGFEYRAGQFADYTLLSPSETDDEGNTRGFTLASAPFEPTLTATTRLRAKPTRSEAADRTHPWTLAYAT